MGYGKQRVILRTQRGVGAVYAPINRYLDDITVTVVPNGATYTVDYTQQNVIRAPSPLDTQLTGLDIVAPASAIWTNLGSPTNDAIVGKIMAYAIRLDVTAVTGGAISAAIAEDGGVFVDETTEANEATANDMTLFPAVPVAAVDRYNFGFDSQVSNFDLDVSTVGTGTYTVVWEYWDGNAWTVLAGIVDGTTGFKVTARNNVAWTVPADWSQTFINGQGPFYFVRAEIQTGTVTAVPIGEQAFDMNSEATIRIAQG